MTLKLRIPPPCHAFLQSEILKLDNGSVVVRFSPTDEMANPFGTVQGGILAGMLDNCIGPALVSAVPDRQASLVQLSVSYLGAARPGQTLIGRARVVKHGRTQALIEAGLETELDGKLLVKALATNVFLDTAVQPVDLDSIKS
ncbi:MAG: PaaI family thioesterase [Candidatus Alcyoniella australis]|nr:PaaI family thioesterase [Candidatus Alcyoniella australis]